MNAITSDEITLKRSIWLGYATIPIKPRVFCHTRSLASLGSFAVRLTQRGTFKANRPTPTAGRVPNLAVLFAANHEWQAQGDKPKDSFATLTIFA